KEAMARGKQARAPARRDQEISLLAADERELVRREQRRVHEALQDDERRRAEEHLARDTGARRERLAPLGRRECQRTRGKEEKQAVLDANEYDKREECAERDR